MKIFLRVAFFCWLIIVLTNSDAVAQTTTRPPNYAPGGKAWNALLKESKRKAIIPRSGTRTTGSIKKTTQTLVAPACLVPVDASFTTLERGDNISSEPIQLPFSFNLYGTPYNQVYINTDGVLSFLEPVEEYLPVSLPYYEPLIAPFWSDVDTRHPSSGQIHYKVTPTHLIVTWDHVGYADQEGDKLNTFQVILGVPGDELLGPTANLKMSYGDMQWASAYEGGDFPALVGINGDFFQHYQQIGLFGKTDDSYDGPAGQQDGIGYLANKCFSYDLRTLPNLPPQFNMDNLSRVIELNVGETVEIEPFFTAPEPGQTVTTEVRSDEGEICKVNYSVTNGPVSRIKLKIEGDPCNAGFHFLYLTATDNGNPQQVTTVTLLIWIKQGAAVVTFPTPTDEDKDGRYPLKATASTGQPVFYAVMAGPGYIADDTLVATGVGSILVRAYAENDGSQPMAFKDAVVCVPVKAPGAISGDATACLINEATYSVPAVDGAIFHWTLDGVALESVVNEVTVKWPSLGSHQLAVSYSSNCGAAGPVTTLAVQVINNPLQGSITKMLPSDGNTNVAYPLTFSWFAVEKAISYDIFVWPADAAQPAQPMFKDITAINYTLYRTEQLDYGRMYKWRVVARGTCGLLESPVQSFQLRYLPDLIPVNIQAAPTAFSGQPVTINWQVKNTGQGSTLDRQWLDRVYLSSDLVLDEHDIKCMTLANTSALNSGGSYANTATFNLPNGLNNKYYVIVVADEYGQIEDKDRTNNIAVSAAPINIQLTPPPDLQVSTVTPPNNAFSGQLVEVIWTVTNAGTGKASGAGWLDVLYLSKEAVLNTSSAIKLATTFHGPDVSAGGSYTQKVLVNLPDTVSGDYYVHVVTDWTDALYEHAAEDNNTGSSGVINIIQAPPVDLVVQQIAVPPTAPVGSNVSVRWQVANTGGAGTPVTYWRDAVYLSPTPVFDPKTAIELGTQSRSTALGAGESYTVDRAFVLPKRLTGSFYVFVQTDVFKDVYEQEAEGNNLTMAAQVLLITTPDLVVKDIVAPGAGLSGQGLTVSYKFRNNGSVLANTRITDRILVSKNAVFDEANATVVKLVDYATGRIEGGRDTARTTSIVLPEGISGNYYVYVQTDYKDTVFESANDNNIGRSAAPVAVALGPWADLQVNKVTIAGQAEAGALTTVSYTVVNKGNRSTNDSNWTDKIYVWQQPVWDASKAVLIRELPQQAAIGKDSAYQVSIPVKLPGNIGGADYYFYVVTNANKQVYERGDTLNNTGKSAAVFIKKYPPVDLVVTSVSAPATGRSGNPITVQWTVKNAGEAITLPGQWNDVLYLSADTVWDSGDQVIKSFVHRGDLPVQGTYTHVQEIVLPNGLSGRFYLLAGTDPENVNYDADPANNRGLVRNGNEPVAMGIELTPPADLVVAKFSTPDEGFAGQPVKLKWIVKNKGAGNTNKASWTEKVFLSDDVVLDGLDIPLGTYVRQGVLAAGASYEDSLEVFLPSNRLGNHVLIFQSDANDNVYEHQAEMNLATAMITILKDDLSDLIVTDVEVPATGEAGGGVKVQWKVKNVGTHPARGYFQQSLFLSTDNIKDAADVPVGTLPVRTNLAPGGVLEQSMKIDLKGVSLRDYYALVHVDVLNNIPETEEDNNLSSSAQPMRVTVEQLELGVVKAASLVNGRDRYYRIDVPDSLVGASLLIALEGDSAMGDNSLFARLGDVPGPATHDFASEIPYQANQELVIPALRSGTYYLLINGRMRSSAAQPVKIKAAVLHFEIRSVDAREGGNTGLATVLVKGAKLNNVRAVRLRNSAQVLAAERVEVINPTSLFARFNLYGATPGIYDVVAENIDGDTTMLAQGFTIVAGTGGVLSTSIVSPPNTRPSNVLSFQVEFANTGNTDILHPVVRITSIGGAPIALKPADLDKAGKTLTLTVQETDGPAGRLRPGAKGSVVVYAKATTVLGFMLMDSDQ